MSSRRRLLKSALLAPLAALARPAAADYASAVEVFDAVDRLEADVRAWLGALAKALPACGAFATSLSKDYARHRERRAALRRRLRLPAGAPLPSPAAGDATLAGLRAAVESLVYAHVEGLPALGDDRAVDVMAHHMVDLSRHLTIVDLWIEQEQARG
jgi:hypothetical protein